MMKRGALMTREWVAAMLMSIASFALPSERAHAADQQRMADVACVVVGLRMVQMTAPQERTAGLILAAYYLGRLEGEVSDAESEQLIESEAGKITAAEFRANATRCGKALTAKGQEIQKISADLSHKAQGGAALK